MYKKALSILVLGSGVFLACCLCIKGVDYALVCQQPVELLKLELEQLEEKAKAHGIVEVSGTGSIGESRSAVEGGLGIAGIAVSGPRVVDCTTLEQDRAYELSDQDMEVLLRIVEAEAAGEQRNFKINPRAVDADLLCHHVLRDGWYACHDLCEDEEGKLLVANVILNRVSNEAFPDTVKEVVFQCENGVSQFSPISDGRYYEVIVSKETIHAVSRAIRGEDISEGALYFAAREHADVNRMKWFDEKLTFLFAHGAHEFFK